MPDLSIDQEETQSTGSPISTAEIEVHDGMVFQDLIKEEGEVTAPAIISKMDSNVDSPSRPNYVSSCGSSNLLLNAASDTSDASKTSNQSEASHVLSCQNGAICFKLGCQYGHPSDWYVCEIGVDCKVLKCKGTHPYKRKGPCRYLQECPDSECQFLHPDTRPSACPQGEECRQWHCKKPHPKSRPTKCFYEEECNNLESCPHLHPPGRNLCHNGAKYVKLSRHGLHLPNRILHTQQLAVDEKESDFIKDLLDGAIYFLMKSSNEENVVLAQEEGVWSTTFDNEDKLNRAFRQHRNVILFFSVNESKAFQGFARMSSEACHDNQPINWVLPPGRSNLAFSGFIYIDWISRRRLPFIETVNLYNSWNDNKPVKIGRDGQEIEPNCAKTLCHLFLSGPTTDTTSTSRKQDQYESSRPSLSMNPSKDINHRSYNSMNRDRCYRSRSRECSSHESHRKRQYRSRSRERSSHESHRKRQYRSRSRERGSHESHRKQQYRSRSRERSSHESHRKRQYRSRSRERSSHESHRKRQYRSRSRERGSHESHRKHSGGAKS